MNKVVFNNTYGGFELSKKAVDWLRAHGVSENDIAGYLNDAFPRHDPLLVQLVEELGKEASQSLYSNLQITEIDGDIYRIEEYDGKETVVTPENEDWLIIK